MAVQVVSASGTQYPLIINADGSINISGNVGIAGSIIIGSVSANVDSVFVASGNMFVNSGTIFIADQVPTNANKNNSAYSYTYTAGNITKVVQFIGAGSYVQDWTWGGGSVLINVGSWY